MNTEMILEALRDALPKLRGAGVAKLKSALAQYDEASKPQTMSAESVDISRADYDLCSEWVKAQQTELYRNWYGSGDNGHSEEVEVSPHRLIPDEVAGAFERISDAVIETESGLENGNGGEVCVCMDRDGLSFGVSYIELVPGQKVMVSFENPPALDKQKALPAP